MTKRLRQIVVCLSVVFASQVSYAHDECELELRGPEFRAWSVNSAHESLKALAAAPPVRVKVATWNLNLLHMEFRLGPMPLGRMTTPRYQTRSRDVPGALDSRLGTNGPDILMLQEVWTAEDHEAVAAAADKWNYVIAESELERGLRHGMQLLVRKNLFLEGGFSRIDASKRTLFESVARVERGLLWSKVRLHDGQTVFVGTVHLTPFARYHNVRLEQVQGMNLKELTAGMDHTLLGGDFNIAADFTSEHPYDLGRLDHGKYLYAHFADLTGLRDAYRAVEPNLPGYTFDPDFSDSGWIRVRAEQRIDYIWTAENVGGVYQHVVGATVSQWQASDGKPLSDHHLLEVAIDFFRVSHALGRSLRRATDELPPHASGDGTVGQVSRM